MKTQTFTDAFFGSTSDQYADVKLTTLLPTLEAKIIVCEGANVFTVTLTETCATCGAAWKNDEFAEPRFTDGAGWAMHHTSCANPA